MSKHPLCRSARALVLALLCVAFGAGAALGQSQASSGQIGGAVTDTNGAAVPNATVKAANTETGQERTVITSEDGLYNIVLLPPGTYTVTALASGFAETKVENVVVNVGRTADVNVVIGAGGVTESINVTAEAVQTTRSESDAVLNERAIENLPINGRRFQDFVTLTPTAQVDPQRGQISLSGQRGINSNINVDGVDYNQSFFGGIRGGERSNQAFTLPQEAIKEFQVVASGYSAEFGRSSGGIVNAVTKSGTNDIHGSAFFLLRPKSLSSENDFVRAIKDDFTERGLDFEVTPAPTQKQFGGSIGGPVKEDKLFYFFAYEQQIFEADRRVFFGGLNAVTRGPANQEAFDFYQSLETAYTQTNDALAGLGRLDWQINQDHRFNFRYNYSQNKAENGNATGENVLDPTTSRALTNNGTERNRNNIGVIQLASIFSPRLVNEFRFQFAREDRPRSANSIGPNLTTGAGTFGTRNFLPTTQYDTRTQFADNITWVEGNHTAKFGVEYSHIFADQIFGFNQFGTYGLTGNTAAQLASLSLTPGTSDRRFDATGDSYLQQIGNLSASYDVDEFGVFAQDSWRLRQNFTVNYGLRVDQQFNPEPEATNTALINVVQNTNFPLRGGPFNPTQIPDSGWQFGPRLGFAWDPTSDGKTVVRAFTGLYYARTPLLVLAAPFNNFRDPAGDLSVRIPFAVPSALLNNTGGALTTFLNNNPGYVSILQGTGLNCFDPAAPTACAPNTVFRQFALIGVNLNAASLGSLPTLTPQQTQQIAARINPSINPLVAGIQPIGIDENFKNPRSFQFGFAFEREVSPGITLGADYSHVNTVYLQRNREINLPVPVPISAAQRPSFRPTGSLVRPASALGSLQLRESSARSLFQAFTLRARVLRRWGQLNAFYTLSRSLSDDDNERDAGGQAAENTYNLVPEYNYSRLDRRHQFVANPVVFLPFGFEVASAIRLRSGVPIDALVGTDVNGDTFFTDRPFSAPGVPFKRNDFRNRPVYEVDLRVQKGFNFDEVRRLIFSAEFFNLFNAQNIQFAGATVVNYCDSRVTTNLAECGLGGATNLNFLQVFEQRPDNPRLGQYLLNNTLGSQAQVRQVQLGVRFQF